MQELQTERTKEAVLLSSNKFQPFDGAAAYPLRSREFKTTGFTEVMPALCARDYKDQKVVVEKDE